MDSGAVEYNEPVPALFARREDGSVRLSFEAAPGQSYRLEHSASFTAWELHELIGPFATNAPVVRLVTPFASARYFRLKLNF